MSFPVGTPRRASTGHSGRPPQAPFFVAKPPALMPVFPLMYKGKPAHHGCTPADPKIVLGGRRGIVEPPANRTAMRGPGRALLAFVEDLSGRIFQFSMLIASLVDAHNGNPARQGNPDGQGNLIGLGNPDSQGNLLGQVNRRFNGESPLPRESLLVRESGQPGESGPSWESACLWESMDAGESRLTRESPPSRESPFARGIRHGRGIPVGKGIGPPSGIPFPRRGPTGSAEVPLECPPLRAPAMGISPAKRIRTERGIRLTPRIAFP